MESNVKNIGDSSEIDVTEFPGTPENYSDKEVILEVRNLRKYFPVKSKSLMLSRTIGHIKAVDGIDLQLFKGEVLGLVGESGCGKSTFSKVIVGLEKPTTGEVWLKDLEVHTEKNTKKVKEIRRNLQQVFQDPYNSLNPRRRVIDTLIEPLKIHNLNQKEEKNNVLKMLKKVGLEEYHALRYPHEFSGGQRQRIGLARALIMNPDVVIADEPVSALDVSVQASILNLIQDLQSELDTSIIFIAHDLSVVKHVSNRVAVMYLGKIMEIGPSEEVFNRPAHPYTVSLLSAIPFPDPDIQKKKVILEGDVPSPINLPPGCRFADRCYKVQEKCSQETPVLEKIRGNIWAACFYPEDEQVIIMDTVEG